MDERRRPLAGEVLQFEHEPRANVYGPDYPRPDHPPERTNLGRFAPGNAWAWKPGNPGGPGRPIGLRNKVTTDFLTALSEDFARHGMKAIQRMRNAKPHVYVQVIASLLPKQVQIEDKPFDGLGDTDLATIILAAQAALSAHRELGERAKEALGHEPPQELPTLPETS
jgi:hypothetical protein